MEHAKKMVLIEPRELEQLRLHSEYRDMQKPADKKTKASLSLDLQKVLADDVESDDIKAKKYQQTFSRLKAMSDHIPESERVSFNTTTPRVRHRGATPRLRRTKQIAWTQY
jgi:hypothetical protein